SNFSSRNFPAGMKNPGAVVSRAGSGQNSTVEMSKLSLNPADVARSVRRGSGVFDARASMSTKNNDRRASGRRMAREREKIQDGHAKLAAGLTVQRGGSPHGGTTDRHTGRSLLNQTRGRLANTGANEAQAGGMRGTG